MVELGGRLLNKQISEDGSIFRIGREKFSLNLCFLGLGLSWGLMMFLF